MRDSAYPAPVGDNPVQRDNDFLKPFSSGRTVWAFAVLFCALLFAFRQWPGIDTTVSDLFFAPETCPAVAPADSVCGSFPVSRPPFWRGLRETMHMIPPIVGLLLAALLGWRRLRGIRVREHLNLMLLSAVASLVLAPGLLVNSLLKEHWGRPRPYMTTLFGGDMPFVPAGSITDYCASNCSFVSGEAASAFWLVGAAALAPKPYRTVAMAAGLLLASFMAGLRLAFGAHFLSDITLGGLLSLLVFSVVAAMLKRRVTPPNL